MDELHRNSVAEFKGQPMSKISKVDGMDDIIEAARLAPSGVNNQPWFITGRNGLVHAYCSRSLIEMT
jgi:nitroreductase